MLYEVITPARGPVSFSGGEGGIRTPGTVLAYTHFPGGHLKPLSHLSNFSNSKIIPNIDIFFISVITSYSIHYTKLYEVLLTRNYQKILDYNILQYQKNPLI